MHEARQSFLAERVVIAAVGLLILGLTIYGYASGYPTQALRFPVLVAIGFVIFAGFRLREQIVSADADETLSAEDRARTEEGLAPMRDLVVPFGWLFASILFVWLLGFVAGLTLYVFAYLLAFRFPLKVTLPLTAGTGLFIYFVFGKILQVLLPSGLLLSLLH